MKNYINHFFDIVSDNKKTVLIINVRLIISLLPWLVLFLIEIINRYLIYSSHEMDEAINLYNKYYVFNISFQLMKASAILCFTYCFSLNLFTLRNMVWYNRYSSLIEAIKKTGKVNILLTSIFVINYFLFKYSILYLSVSSFAKTQKIMIYSLLGIYAYFTFSLFIFSICQNSIYNNSIFRIFKNSFILSVVKFPKNMLYYIVFIIPPILIILSKVIVLIFIMFILFILAGICLFELVIYLYVMDVFDLYINKRMFKNYYRKGLERYDYK